VRGFSLAVILGLSLKLRKLLAFGYATCIIHLTPPPPGKQESEMALIEIKNRWTGAVLFA
jgi:hypothetical protein